MLKIYEDLDNFFKQWAYDGYPAYLITDPFDAAAMPPQQQLYFDEDHSQDLLLISSILSEVNHDALLLEFGEESVLNAVSFLAEAKKTVVCYWYLRNKRGDIMSCEFPRKDHVNNIEPKLAYDIIVEYLST